MNDTKKAFHAINIIMADWGSGFNPTNIQHIEDLKFICNKIINAYMKNY